MRKFLPILLSLIYTTTICFSAEVKLVASDGNEAEHFGWSVSISGDYIIVGAPGVSNNDGTGAAYIFKRNIDEWNEQAKLMADDAAIGDEFGYSVSISGDHAVIGAQEDDDNGTESGSAYIFRRSGSTWTQVAKLTPMDGAQNDRFGWSVSISGTYVIVGTTANAAYIFEGSGSTWTQKPKLIAVDGALMFGSSVAVFGEYAIVGAYADNENGDYSGSTYIFHHVGGNWNQQAKVTASDGSINDYFGRSVSVTNGYALIGADGDNNNSGSAYIFKQNGNDWIQQAKLVASDASENNYFGFSVSMTGNFAFVGAFGNASSSGSAYAYLRNGSIWNETKRITASDVLVSDQFGESVSMSDQYAVVGSRYADNSNGQGAGSAYVFNTVEDLALPIKLISFTAIARNRQIELHWSTASELDNIGFILERSVGKDEFFEELASYENYPELRGQMNSNVITNYSFEDNTVINGTTYYYRLIDVDLNGNKHQHQTVNATPNTNAIDIKRKDPVLSKFYLYQNYPNPFNPETTIKFEVPVTQVGLEQIELAIYNSIGKKVKEIFIGSLAPGVYEIKWNGQNDDGIRQPSGVYFIHYQTNHLSKSRKILIIR
jgi:hypothetical protein